MKPTVPPEPQLTRVQCGVCAWMSAAHESAAEAFLEVGAHFVNVHRYAAAASTPEPPRKAKVRRYPIPEGYPVPAEHIPDMPIDQYHLHAFGVLSPMLCRAMGVKVMTCSYCGDESTLALRGEPLGAEGVRGNIGSLVWGQDVAVICQCCSGPNCSHRGERARQTQ